MLVCSYIESLLVAAKTVSSPPKQQHVASPPLQPSLPTPPDEPPTRPPPPTSRRSLDYIAERPNGSVIPVFGEEYGMGVGYDEVDLQRQRQRIALRFSSKSVPKISILDYLDRFVHLLKRIDRVEYGSIMMYGHRCC
jgi:hypothetical protein